MEPKYYADGEDAYAMKRDLTQMADEVSVPGGQASRAGPLGVPEAVGGLLQPEARGLAPAPVAIALGVLRCRSGMPLSAEACTV